MKQYEVGKNEAKVGKSPAPNPAPRGIKRRDFAGILHVAASGFFITSVTKKNDIQPSGSCHAGRKYAISSLPPAMYDQVAFERIAE